MRRQGYCSTGRSTLITPDSHTAAVARLLPQRAAALLPFSVGLLLRRGVAPLLPLFALAVLLELFAQQQDVFAADGYGEAEAAVDS